MTKRASGNPNGNPRMWLSRRRAELAQESGETLRLVPRWLVPGGLGAREMTPQKRRPLRRLPAAQLSDDLASDDLVPESVNTARLIVTDSEQLVEQEKPT